MDRAMQVLVFLVYCTALASPAAAEKLPPTETDRLRQEVTELKALVAQLSHRVQMLEVQLSDNPRSGRVFLVGHQEPVAPVVCPPATTPVPLQSVDAPVFHQPMQPAPPQFHPTGAEKGMQFDALEHQKRWQEALERSRTAPYPE